MQTRREFVKGLGMTAGLLWATTQVGWALEEPSALHLATNQYPWSVFYGREGKSFEQNLDAGLGEVASAGLNGFEPMIGGPENVDQFVPILKKHKLEMRSLYVNSTLHLQAEADKSIAHILAIAKKAKEYGTRIIVTNPNPIQWGGTASKDDAMLHTQRAAMDELGRQLSLLGMVLSYHNHDVELRNAAREFHHMMAGTNPKYVTLCLDAHWIYRGSGNSAIALFDVVELYGKRVSELHLRQSVRGVWSETFDVTEKGDIDYVALAKALTQKGVKPHLVLEQAVENGSPKTLNATEAHRQSAEYARKVFAKTA
ncbi:MAG TPA: sugar phosphate isomerase/epimerase [Tepidisphaeraceae bacterium]|nr:sugar phosphate isomerase/epimerase [Tepidisphaeraceae bacterium]